MFSALSVGLRVAAIETDIEQLWVEGESGVSVSGYGLGGCLGRGERGRFFAQMNLLETFCHLNY